MWCDLPLMCNQTKTVLVVAFFKKKTHVPNTQLHISNHQNIYLKHITKHIFLFMNTMVQFGSGGCVSRLRFFSFFFFFSLLRMRLGGQRLLFMLLFMNSSCSLLTFQPLYQSYGSREQCT